MDHFLRLQLKFKPLRWRVYCIGCKYLDIPAEHKIDIEFPFKKFKDAWDVYTKW